MLELNIDFYKNELSAAISKKDSKAITDLFYEIGMLQLSNTFWDEEVFTLILEFIKREEFIKLQASVYAIVLISDEYDKISKKQKKVILEYFDKSIPGAAHNDFLYAIADLIARKHSEEEAYLTLKKWFKTGSTVNQYIGKSGLETLLIMSPVKKFEPVFIKKIEQTLGFSK